MSDQRAGGIAWTEQTWNPIRGCSRISEGCRNCYAEKVAQRFSGAGQPYHGLATPRGWTGEVRVIEEHMEDPLRWKRPRRVFVNSMSDLFHESLAEESIRRVFDVMIRAKRHTFQVLTKRAARMRDLCAKNGWNEDNIWLGVSGEDQRSADIRVAELCETPASVRWVSVEPMIGPVMVRASWEQSIDWVVIGGESGPGARAMNLEWIRDLVRDCRDARIKVFVKQLGARVNWPSTPPGKDMAEWPEDLRVREYP